MTREEEIWNAINNLQIGNYNEDDPSDNDEYDGSDLQNAFCAGAKWADANPKSPWISVKDKLPCDEKDMVIEYVTGLELRTKKVCVLLEDGFIDITYMYSFPPNGWHWNICDAITHWFPIPEPPKE